MVQTSRAPREGNMRLAKCMSRLGTETAFEVLLAARKLEAQGRDIVHLEIGEPDFDTPKNVIEKGVWALQNGFTHYGPSAGIPDVRKTFEFIMRRGGIWNVEAFRQFPESSPERQMDLLSMLKNHTFPGNTFLPDDVMDYFVETFEATGFTGGLNWYRNIGAFGSLPNPNWRVEVPCLYVGAEHDVILRPDIQARNIDLPLCPSHRRPHPHDIAVPVQTAGKPCLFEGINEIVEFLIGQLHLFLLDDLAKLLRQDWCSIAIYNLARPMRMRILRQYAPFA